MSGFSPSPEELWGFGCGGRTPRQTVPQFPQIPNHPGGGQTLIPLSTPPGKPAPPSPPSRGGPAPAPSPPYSVETPYGYRLDLDFLKYVDDIEKGHTLRRLPVRRRPRCASASWWPSTESLCSTDSLASALSYGPRDARVESTLLGARRKLEGQAGPSGLRNSRLSLAGSGLSTPATPTPGHLQHVREQMAGALRQLRQLEEQVKLIPVLQVKVAVLQEEKRQLSTRLQSRRGLGQPVGGPGELYLDLPEEEMAARGTRELRSVAVGTEGGTSGQRSVGVGVPEPEMMELGAGAGEGDTVRALSARVALLERQLQKALGELQDARQRLGQGAGARGQAVGPEGQVPGVGGQVEETRRKVLGVGEQTPGPGGQRLGTQGQMAGPGGQLGSTGGQMQGEQGQVGSAGDQAQGAGERAEVVRVVQVPRGPEIAASTAAGPAAQPQHARGLEPRDGPDLLEMALPRLVLAPAHGHAHGAHKISIIETGAAQAEARASARTIGEDPEPPGGSSYHLGGINGGYESASSDSSTAENSEAESTESEYHEASEGLPAGGAETPKATEEEAAAGAALSTTQGSNDGLGLGQELLSACTILKRYLETPNASMDTKTRDAYGVVQQDWLGLACGQAVEATAVSQRLDTYRAFSPRVLATALNMTDGHGNTALHHAVSCSNFPLVRRLLDTGLCDVDKPNQAGYTALMLTALAAAYPDADRATVLQLLRAGNVDARATQAGQTALMLAVSHGRQDVARVLLACGANVNLQDADGSTALMCACEHGHAAIAHLLLAAPACRVDLADNDGSTALSIAQEAGQTDIVNMIEACLGAPALGNPLPVTTETAVTTEAPGDTQ
ncbi:KN motif and ankyrin repeat domain-containing protein 2 isoform X1 [Alligator sinensis]|uniref:KN motif and ankyrin repeat domain-containing protein 2 n=1 Tax=Alligator sinensis TaxID=38654 RepID=A0A3Q0GNI3_ALLSI|nr:KN motif and ankyrin repeat domain-containing protein 2 isoform X1 [Alligator sinensis]XP_025059749.1 KN motif and ankyrin repeat domain-containing protein 2 isoform X1 [Alligator sinensis]